MRTRLDRRRLAGDIEQRDAVLRVENDRREWRRRRSRRRAFRRASRRQANNCCGVRPWRRATWLVRAPSSKLSATIAAFFSAVQVRRRPSAGEDLKPPRRSASPFDTSLCSEIDTCRSRGVLSHRLSNTNDASFCAAALEEALPVRQAADFQYRSGLHFHRRGFRRRAAEAGVAISMDGRGRFMDNIFIERLWRSIKYEEVVCCERHRSQSERWRCFTGDEGRSLEVGLQGQASNRHELHWSRAIVVNVDGKGGAGLRQVRIKETNASKPLMTCRNVSDDVETGTRTSVPRMKD